MVKKALTRDNKPIKELKVYCKINKRINLQTHKKLKIENEKILKTLKFKKVWIWKVCFIIIYLSIFLKKYQRANKKPQIKLLSSLITYNNKLIIFIVNYNKTSEL